MRWLDRQHDQLNGHEFEPTLGESEGQGSLAQCSSWGCKELDMAQQLSNNNNAGSFSCGMWDLGS